MPAKGLTITLALCLAWLYGDAGRGLILQWVGSPDAAYGAILAGVALLLFWQDRSRLAPRLPLADNSFAGLVLIVGGLLAYLAGFFAADLFTTRASFVVVLAGLLWFVSGPAALRTALTPLIFLLLAIPLPELVVTSLTSSLQTVAARTAEVTLGMAGIPVYRDGNVLELPATTLQVVEACSGLRSVVSLASVGILLVWATPGPRSRRAVLLLATVPIAVVINGLRIAGTGAAAEAWGPALTRDPYHSIAGWLTFVLSLGALWALRRLLLRQEPAIAYPAVQVVHT